MRSDLDGLLGRVGSLPKGRLNRITDVAGVRVGHSTLADERHRTGVTVVIPCEDDPFANQLTAAGYVLNGFGKTLGLMQLAELGTLETPIALTNTLNVGKVHDGIIQYMIDSGADFRSINPIVCECNDAALNDIRDRALDYRHVRAAIDAACLEFDEGGVGAGAGTTCHGLKGGIGSASRVISLEREYTVGVLVQTNHGSLDELQIGGRRVCGGNDIAPAKGSCIMIVATDLPLTDRQMGRLIRRAPVGLIRLGSHVDGGSGEVAIGFTTANRVRRGEDYVQLRALGEDRLSLAFRAVAEATEEAVLRSLLEAESVTGYSGKRRASLRDMLPL